MKKAVRNQIQSLFVLIIVGSKILSNSRHHQVSSFSTSTPKNTFQQHVKQIQKVTPDEFNIYKHYFHEKIIDNHDGGNKHVVQRFETPVLIENVLSPIQCEDICDVIVSNLGHVSIDLQRKKRKVNKNHDDEDNNDESGIKEQTKIYEYTLNEAFSLMMESKRNDSLFCFCEGLLDTKLDDESLQNEVDEVKQFLTAAKESMFEHHEIGHGHGGSRSSDNTNLFDYFPENVKPSDCLILAGEGATSTLHRDPFCWTGTSLCLEGTKVWRFVAPPGIDKHETNKPPEDSDVTYVDSLLDSYRLQSVAWEDDSSRNNSSNPVYLSSGWQSDYSLYSTFRHDDYPSAEDLASMDEDEKIAWIEDMSQDLDLFSPNIAQTYSKSSDYGSTPVSIWTVVQKPGDLLIIPAYWWHQTYAFEPSLAIASQRCGTDRDFTRVFGHMIECSSPENKDSFHDMIMPFKDEEYVSKQSAKTVVQTFFEEIKKLKC